ncbi:hypothetical protein NQ314_013426 [Rhamnusium bicolor]|uniref:Uncharacterized protein n=1 Tax=Rhamnusium bicolor TaxID=1586634 RepID=A0AAV8X707_9CUCU|nr:hypothetical protein NQ314_013426 [Rhamnusium bicolor]
MFELKFQEKEKKRYQAEQQRFDLKHQRQLEELRAMSDATIKELEQLQNEKRKMLLEHETLKLKQREEAFSIELKEWKAKLKPRKQKLEDKLYREMCSAKYIQYLPKVSIPEPGSSSTDSVPDPDTASVASASSVPSSPFIQDAHRPIWGHQRTWSTGKLEETFAQQLEEQERVYGPITPLALPSDLTDLNTDSCSRIGIGSTRSSLSSVSEG